ncbi:MAG TPA: gluconokinase, GntK/IdnK-type [Verrucomicrobiae bacterium]|nr:gluconokinase, GntK/IdnK-type [Verrucomicrobiae bacterium]
MGVTGSGKTTTGTLLASELGWKFVDGDDFHSQSNIEKILRGIALTDEDRRPWLARLRNQIQSWIAQHQNVILACSALKESYRQELKVDAEVKFVYLKGSLELIRERLRARHGHFAGVELLASQFADLEEPENAVMVDISGSPSQIVREIRERLSLS